MNIDITCQKHHDTDGIDIAGMSLGQKKYVCFFLNFQKKRKTLKIINKWRVMYYGKVTTNRYFIY